MTRKTVAVAAIVAALGVVPMLAQGQGPGPQGRGRGGPGGPGGPGVPNLMAQVQRLDLSDEQRQQLRQSMEDGRQAGDPGAPMRDAERKLHEAILADTPDASAIEAAKAAVNAAHTAQLEHQVVMMQKIAQILTPAQRQQLLQFQPPGGPPRHH
jgi:Spy/CpxP family protein refolding chaperone